MKTAAPGGEWETPITSATLVTDVVGLAEPAYGPDGALYNLESRPSEGGRSVLVRRAPGGGPPVDVTPPPSNVRTRVHEYGGGAFAVVPQPSVEGATLVLFSNFGDQRLMQTVVASDGAITPPTPLTREPTTPAGLRFADCVPDPGPRPRVYYVLEDHEGGGGEPTNCVAAVDLTSGDITRLSHPTDASDFVAFVVPSPDGTAVAWVAWTHPNMPWDSTVLKVARVQDDGMLSPAVTIAGGDGISVQAPLWLPDGGLAFVSDQESGWWNVWRTAPGVDVASAKTPPPHTNLCPLAAEFGGPAWVHGLRPLVLLPSGRLLVRVADPASPGVQVGTLGVEKPGPLTPLAFPFAGASRLAVHVTGDGGAVALAAVATRPDAPSALVTATLESDGSMVGAWTKIAAAFDLTIDPAYLSTPQVITFPTDPVPGSDDAAPVAHGIYYPPTNPEFKLPAGAAPPVLIKIHGGPTAAASSGALSLGIQYWTSRGFAVVS